MKNVQNALRKVLVPLNHFVHRIVLLIAQISMMAMVAIVTLTVVLRYCFNTGLSWAEEVPRLLVTLFAFIACAIGVRDHLHVAGRNRRRSGNDGRVLADRAGLCLQVPVVALG